MKTIYVSVLMSILFTVSAVSTQAQTAWKCDGAAIGTYNPVSNSYNDDTKLYRAEFDANGNVNYVNKTATTGIGLNAIGYRRQDNFVYGVRYTKSNGNNNELCRVDADGNIVSLGAISGLKNNIQYFAGAFDNDGFLYASTGSGNSSYDLYKIDVVNKSAVKAGSLGTNRLVDLAIDPITNVMYATNANANSDNGDLLVIDINANPITISKKGSVGAFMFGLFFTDEAQLYGFGRASNNTTSYYKINKTTGVATKAGKGPVATNADACSCPYRLSHTLTTAKNVLYAGMDTALTIAITNLSGGVQNTSYDLTMDNRFSFTQTEAQIQAYIQSLFPGSTANVVISNYNNGVKNKISINTITVPITTSSVASFSLKIRVGLTGITTLETVYLQSKLDVPGNTLNIGMDDSDNPLTAQLDDASPLTIAPVMNAPLPLQVTNFKGQLNQNNVQLTWETKQEVNTQKFEIERSLNGVNFIKVDEVSAKGSASTIANYGFNDMLSVAAATIYYRIKIIDLDGSFKYTSIVVLKLNAISSQITVYPSPFVDKIAINTYTDTKTTMTVLLSDGVGRRVINKTTELTRGNNTVTLNNLSGLAKGIYYVNIYDGNVLLETKKIVKNQ